MNDAILNKLKPDALERYLTLQLMLGVKKPVKNTPASSYNIPRIGDKVRILENYQDIFRKDDTTSIINLGLYYADGSRFEFGVSVADPRNLSSNLMIPVRITAPYVEPEASSEPIRRLDPDL